MRASRPNSRYGAAMPLSVGFAALALLVGGGGVWSVRTQIAGAVIARGMIVVENNRQVIQHTDGGMVDRILVRDGNHVIAGSAVIVLDDTLLAADMATINTQLVEIRARKARLLAERDDSEAPNFPEDLLAASQVDAATAEQVEGQRQLYAAQRRTRVQEKGQLEEQILQIGNQITGTEAQLRALSLQRTLISDERSDEEALLADGLVPAQRVHALRREEARIDGDIGRLAADIARARGQIAAIEIEKLKQDAIQREEAIAASRDIRFRELELSGQRRDIQERISRLTVRAPASGIVYGSTVFAENSVVRAAEPLMYIVPQDRPLVVSARVEAIHIDQIHVGQQATLRFTAFDQRLTPEIPASLTDVSADVFQDEVTGLSYYRVALLLREEDLAQLGGQTLVPGMPVEAHLRTSDRTPLSYLVKPMTDYFRRALREG